MTVNTRCRAACKPAPACGAALRGAWGALGLVGAPRAGRAFGTAILVSGRPLALRIPILRAGWRSGAAKASFDSRGRRLGPAQPLPPPLAPAPLPSSPHAAPPPCTLLQVVPASKVLAFIAPVVSREPRTLACTGMHPAASNSHPPRPPLRSLPAALLPLCPPCSRPPPRPCSTTCSAAPGPWAARSTTSGTRPASGTWRRRRARAATSPSGSTPSATRWGGAGCRLVLAVMPGSALLLACAAGPPLHLRPTPPLRPAGHPLPPQINMHSVTY